jgi:hypothetical protein
MAMFYIYSKLRFKQMRLTSEFRSPLIAYLYSKKDFQIQNLIIYCCTFNGNALEGHPIIQKMGSQYGYLFFDSRGLGLNQS